MLSTTKQIWAVNLEGARGHEQKEERPAIIWKDLDHTKLAIAIPITTTLEREKFPYTHRLSPSVKNGLDKESVALIFQIRSVDKSRFVKKIGSLEETDANSISAILKDLLIS
ncbi:MAG: type II toxin-antitoxin system PemK/MazF family toxin [Candidatus Micrarchaeota archaeon]